MPKAKICGITSAADAQHALLCGADFLGFIFYPPSPRGVTVELAAAIIQELRTGEETGPLLRHENPPLLVGVFVNEAPQKIAGILEQCGLDLAQLSGEEDPDLIAGSGSPILGRAYQALRPKSTVEARASAAIYSAPTSLAAPSLLLDTYHPALRGGTGELADWNLAAEISRMTPRLMLAGGLTPDNVAAAVAQVGPFAVDVASGVEATPGRKDPHKVRRFVSAAHEAYL